MTRIKNIISNQYHQLNLAERGRIEALRGLDWSIRRIAKALHRNPSTISRELRRGTTTQINANTRIFEQSYLAETGEAVYRKHRLNSCYRGLFDHCQTFCNALVTALKARPRMHSVDTFVHQFKTNYPGVVCPSTPTVYRYIDDQRLAIRNSDLPAKLRRRVKRPGTKHHRINKKNLGHSIEERPTVVQARQELGHWEGDLVKGKRVESEPALMTLTERVSRLEIIVKLPNYHADTCLKALQNTLYDYGTEYFKTITFDNGAEFSSLSQVAGTDIYFAHPYSPWERGTNENTNGLLREFFPKGRSLVLASLIDIQLAQDTLNNLLRRSLNYRCPADLMPELA